MGQVYKHSLSLALIVCVWIVVILLLKGCFRKRIQKYGKICILLVSIAMATLGVFLCFCVFPEIWLKGDINSVVLALPWWILPVTIVFVWIAVILILKRRFRKRVHKYGILLVSIAIGVVVFRCIGLVPEIRLKRDVNSVVLTLPRWILPVTIVFVWIAVILILKGCFSHCSSNYDYELQRIHSHKREIIREESTIQCLGHWLTSIKEHDCDFFSLAVIKVDVSFP